jgi:hypothetical protein
LATSIATIAPAWRCCCRACSEPQFINQRVRSKKTGR